MYWDCLPTSSEALLGTVWGLDELDLGSVSKGFTARRKGRVTTGWLVSK